MSNIYLFRQTDQFNRFNQFILKDITDAQAQKILDLMIGDCKLYKGTYSTTTLEERPDKLNTQVFSVLKKGVGEIIKRCSFVLKDMKSDKTLNDVREKKSSLHCHYNLTDVPTKVNLISDKKE